MVKRVTSADVAREVGVSRATVSYLLNNTPGQSISAETRRRVLEAAERLGYMPNRNARALRLGRSDIVLFPLGDAPLSHVFAARNQRVLGGAEPAGFHPGGRCDDVPQPRASCRCVASARPGRFRRSHPACRPCRPSCSMSRAGIAQGDD